MPSEDQKIDYKVTSEKQYAEDARRSLLSVLEDVQAEKDEAERQAQKNDAILAAMEDGVFVVDHDGNITFMNRAGKKIIGRVSEDVIGKSALELLRQGSAGTSIASADELPVTQCMKEKSAVKGPSDFTFDHADGHKIEVDVTAAPLVVHGEIEGAIVVFRDVGRERAIDKMKSEFISVASHQLRTPLSSIRWYAEMLLDGDAGKLNEEQGDYIKEMSKSLDRMAGLVRSLLDVSRIESGRIQVNPVPTALGEIIGGVIEDVKALIEKKKQNVKLEEDETIPQINLDPSLIHEVVMNLTTNALKYTPEGGHVTIASSQTNDMIKIKITDDGLGIPDEQQERIFSKFFRADNAVSSVTDGNGLGLYITKAIVDSSGGEIGFSSTMGKGTTFWFTLPKSGMIKKKGEVTLSRSIKRRVKEEKKKRQ